MKKIFWLVALATMCFASCSKDEVVTPSTIEPSEDFTATLSMSRTHLEGTSVLWDATDQLTIFTKTAHNRQYKVKSGADTKTAVFSYVGYTGTNNAAISGSYAIYPYDAEAELAGNIIKTKWQAEQIYNAAAVNLAYAPMVAYAATGTDLAFKNAGALLRFNLSVAANLPDTYTLQSIKVASAANNLAGTITIDPTADSKAVVTADGVKEVTLSGINAVINATVKSFYVALPATVFAADDLKVTFAFAEGARTVTLPAFTLNQGSIKTIVHQITADEFTGSTEEFGQVADLSEMPIVEPEQVEAVAEAFTEALANPEVEEIKLPENVQLPMTEPISFGAAVVRASEVLAARDITIDGNGGTLVWKGVSGGRVIDVKSETNGMSLTLKNLTIENQTGYTQRGVNYNTNGKLTLENVTIKSAENCSITYAVNLPSSSDNATVEITNSDICGNIALNLWGENTKVTITNSEIKSVDNSAVEGYAAIVLNDDGTTAATGSKITVTGGKIIAKDENGVASTAVQNACIAAEVNISDETEVVGEIQNAVAVILYANTDQYYSVFTLQEAIDKAAEKAGCTVKLIRDITLTETATIAKNTAIKMDMNGYNLHYAVDNNGKAAAIIANNGDLRIENSSNEESTISFVAADPDMAAIPSYATNTITNEATLYIGAGVKVTNRSEGGASYAVDNKGKFTLNGGTLLAERCALRIAKYNQDDVQFTMEGGLVKASTPAWIQLPGNDSSAAPKITVTINGGDFICTKAEEGDVLYTYSFGNSHANTVINIAGGNFLGGTVSIGSGYKGDVPTLHITGGTFDHDVVQWLANDQFNVLYQANANN